MCIEVDMKCPGCNWPTSLADTYECHRRSTEGVCFVLIRETRPLNVAFFGSSDSQFRCTNPVCTFSAAINDAHDVRISNLMNKLNSGVSAIDVAALSDTASYIPRIVGKGSKTSTKGLTAVSSSSSEIDNTPATASKSPTEFSVGKTSKAPAKGQRGIGKAKVSPVVPTNGPTRVSQGDMTAQDIDRQIAMLKSPPQSVSSSPRKATSVGPRKSSTPIITSTAQKQPARVTKNTTLNVSDHETILSPPRIQARKPAGASATTTGQKMLQQLADDQMEPFMQFCTDELVQQDAPVTPNNVPPRRGSPVKKPQPQPTAPQTPETHSTSVFPAPSLPISKTVQITRKNGNGKRMNAAALGSDGRPAKKQQTARKPSKAALKKQGASAAHPLTLDDSPVMATSEISTGASAAMSIATPTTMNDTSATGMSDTSLGSLISDALSTLDNSPQSTANDSSPTTMDSSPLVMMSGMPPTAMNNLAPTTNNGMAPTIMNNTSPAAMNGKPPTTTNGMAPTAANGTAPTIGNNTSQTVINNMPLTTSNGMAPAIMNNNSLVAMNGMLPSTMNGMTHTTMNDMSRNITDGASLTGVLTDGGHSDPF
ncbi:hypothetical protein NKR23_g6004 [Pleurostoma richardsiae]|uniref:Uncharacterized protein n=1 Tax=Pleurostoma richardsiae TaxID=41990 RepID=A0AA38VEH7_9PEZI|nr:hypothetical protein NKR23_g6004 [Pleurostoma richardsiae]